MKNYRMLKKEFTASGKVDVIKNGVIKSLSPA